MPNNFLKEYFSFWTVLVFVMMIFFSSLFFCNFKFSWQFDATKRERIFMTDNTALLIIELEGCLRKTQI